MNSFPAKRPVLSKRDWLKLASLGVLGGSASGWLEALAAEQAPRPKKACILLWMSGGPSHLDTFDPKPGHENGGPFRPIATAVPSVQISEHLPQLSKWTDRMTIIRSLTSKEADHGRGSCFIRTGRIPQANLQYPTLGSFVSKELEQKTSPLPSFVSIAPYRSTNLAAYDSGFLGPEHSPFIVGDITPSVAQQQVPGSFASTLKVRNLMPTVPLAAGRELQRLELLRDMEQSFAATRPDAPVLSHQTAYARAVRLMDSSAASAFDLDDETAKLRDAYGRNLFGQGCLLARRLVERGVPFVEISLGGVHSGGLLWDTHVNNFEIVKRLSAVMDPAWSTLQRDLSDRGLFDSTLIVWMGEFGRTPKINGAAGRDHYPLTSSAVLSGGGIGGGQVIGATTADGVEVADQPCSPPELLATICAALGIDPHKTNASPLGRPVHLVDYDAYPIRGLLP